MHKKEEFLKTYGGIYEHSPWIAEAAFAAGAETLEDIHAAMKLAVTNAAHDKKLALIRAHPDLAGKEAQAGALTDASQAEQKSAGLDRLSGAELARLKAHNAAYRAKFGFPFIICVRNHGKAGIFALLDERLANSHAAEFGLALHEIYAIARLRLEALLAE